MIVIRDGNGWNWGPSWLIIDMSINAMALAVPITALIFATNVELADELVEFGLFSVFA
jgi:hypothetical protein